VCAEFTETFVALGPEGEPGDIDPGSPTATTTTTTPPATARTTRNVNLNPKGNALSCAAHSPLPPANFEL